MIAMATLFFFFSMKDVSKFLKVNAYGIYMVMLTYIFLTYVFVKNLMTKEFVLDWSTSSLDTLKEPTDYIQGFGLDNAT